MMYNSLLIAAHKKRNKGGIRQMSPQKTMKALSLQLPSSKNYQENLDTLVTLIKEHRESEIIVAPEVYLTAYDYEHLEMAAEFSRKAIEKLKEIVDKQILVLTLILKEDDSYINSAVVIHNHTVVYRQKKAILFKLGDEDRYLESGEREDIKPFEIEGVSYAILICFELRFKELWRQIEGVDIVLLPARWGLPRKRHLEILSSALAVMNQCYVIVANSSDADMASSSAIISPGGEVVLNDSSTAIEGTIDFQEIKKIRRYINMA